jgi:hypothetical protein
MSLLTYQKSKYIPITIANLAGNINKLKLMVSIATSVEGPATIAVGGEEKGYAVSRPGHM